MNALLQLIRVSSKCDQSFSVLIDVQQVGIRNAIFFCTGLSMIRTLFGPTIHCQNSESSLSQEFVNTLCLINGTITVGKESVLYHDYYQWVSIYLLLLGFAFYFPYWIWLKRYGKYIRHLESLAPDEAIQIIQDSNGNFIFFKTLALEVFYALYLMVLLGVTDVFFNHLWSQFNWSWKAIDIIFPNNGSCFFDYNHSSGTSTGRFNCLLPMCSVYRKVFFALYLMTIGLIIMNIVIISYHVVLFVLRRKWINFWWAIKIVEESTSSWYVKEKLKCVVRRRCDEALTES